MRLFFIECYSWNCLIIRKIDFFVGVFKDVGVKKLIIINDKLF